MVGRSPSDAPRWGAHVEWRTATYPHAPSDLRLAPGEVHVWSAPLRPPSPVARRVRRSLDDDERARAARLSMARDRRRYVAAHGLLRHVLGHYLTMLPELVRYRYTTRGKPFLVPRTGDPPIEFNASHSDDLALFAVAFGMSVGVDIERIDPGRDVMGIGARFFSPREASVLDALAPEDRLEAFYNCWTRKEAYIKARGDGLSLPLDSFEVSLAPTDPAALLRSALGRTEVERWNLVGLTPAPGFAAALAVERGARRIVGWRLEIPPRGEDRTDPTLGTTWSDSPPADA